ncbi:hypothetical protein Celaphus_00019545 [Cervus elaphus hippelaphus]|uniref:Ubiquitin-related modifier 1 n=1 Tax=Cervus elaphus hippelaphus TaxID=46360 RepID=A0A212C386_CEREH|nr:hypothetical protein Celaphus_00019545 [Cervus elaphus hippelaphus]
MQAQGYGRDEKRWGVSGECGFLNMAAPLSVEAEFGGSVAILFNSVEKHQVTLPGQEAPWDIPNLLSRVARAVFPRQQLFIPAGRDSGVLINDADWELLNYQLQDQDSVLVISTLHGG